ncbi:transmembrane protein 150C [Notolabrus celidotus]|uniref:transmembrane protein 150C n=1 Tax=Notolabrus celidotus TaxID=1203425 RepID=UPI00148FDA49|nr:transmembrane protein 150C [Notolabrus celidotus]
MMEMMTVSRWALLPPVYSILTAAGLWLVYFEAVFHNRISRLGSTHMRNASLYYPYISIAGNFAPASCTFSEVMNLAAFGGFIIAVLRYLQLKHKSAKQWLNFCSLLVFSVACFGMTLVGNFQVFADMATHNIGTFMTFVLGTVFCWVQSYITLKVNIKNEGRVAGILRFVLSGFITIFMILHFSLSGLSLHMQSAQCQWTLVMFFLLFLSTFGIEFRHNHFKIVCTDTCERPETWSEMMSEVSTHHPNEL